jgi:dolichol-phosphate mannosyltransferase
MTTRISSNAAGIAGQKSQSSALPVTPDEAYGNSPIAAPAVANIAVVIPAYRATAHVMGVIEAIPSQVWRIYLVDDCCPEKTGDFVAERNQDTRVVVVRNEINLGVGGAVMRGYAQAAAEGATVIVKLDADGQMNPALIEKFIRPILLGQADYTKGNRFYDLREIRAMPVIRIIGNMVLSFVSKLSSGYWQIFDPTNGFTAIHAKLIARLPLEHISERYFFESDLLFRLNTIRALVLDIPMDAHYADEVSHLKIHQVVLEFGFKHCRNFCKRVAYNYFLRDMSAASLELVAGLLLMLFGGIFGATTWLESIQTSRAAPLGTIMLAALPLLLGFQLLLAFLSFDVNAQVRRALHLDLQ